MYPMIKYLFLKDEETETKKSDQINGIIVSKTKV